MIDPAIVHAATAIIAVASALANIIPPSGRPIPEFIRGMIKIAALNLHKNANKE